MGRMLSLNGEGAFRIGCKTQQVMILPGEVAKQPLAAF